MNPRLAVVTIVDGRPDHLARHRWGLVRQDRTPDLHVVVAVRPGVEDLLPVHDVPWATLVVDAGPADGPLALGAARDAGFAAAAARGVEVVVVLDAACIPAPGLVERYARVLEGREDRAIERPVITCGEVRQLDERTSSLPLSDLRWSDLELGSRTRPAVAATGRSVTHRDGRPSWSASFATTTPSWRRLGGFGDGDAGSSGVDADFGRRLGAAEGTMLWLGDALTYRLAEASGRDAARVGGRPAVPVSTVHPNGAPGPN